MSYATWNLRIIDDTQLDGPESTIVERGGSAQSIWSNGQVETGATILGKVSGDLSNLSLWNFLVISREEAETFIGNNFTPYVEADGHEITLEIALTILD